MRRTRSIPDVIVRNLTPFNTEIIKNRKKYIQKRVGMYFYVTSGAVSADTILIDPNQNQRSFLNTLIHEMLHRECPGWTESHVRGSANRIARIIWEQGYRKEK